MHIKTYRADIYWSGNRGQRVHLSHPGFTEEDALKNRWNGGTFDDARSRAAISTLCYKRSSRCNMTNKPRAVNCPSSIRVIGILEAEAKRLLAR